MSLYMMSKVSCIFLQVSMQFLLGNSCSSIRAAENVLHSRIFLIKILSSELDMLRFTWREFSWRDAPIKNINCTVVLLSAALWTDSQRTRTVLGRRAFRVCGPCDVERPADRTAYCYCVTGVNPAGDAGDTSPPIFWLGGRQWEYPHQYYYVRSDTADQYQSSSPNDSI